jgi:AraC-like DNA-binding protein
MVSATHDRVERASDSTSVASLVARSRANVEESRWLRARARLIVARSRRLCAPPIIGASDASEHEAVGDSSGANGARQPEVAGSETRRSVLVIAHDSVMRAFIADAIRPHHDIVEASDAPSALGLVASGIRVDVAVAGWCMFGEAEALGICASAAREIYDACPWLPMVLIADTPPAALKADLLLTGVRMFVPKDFTPGQLMAAVDGVGRRPDAAVPTSARVAAIKQTFTVLERTITDTPTLTALATMAAMSRSHFSRTFHAVAGISLRDYVRDLRLKRARALMQASRLTLSAIATQAGFYDLPHFNKVFRRRFGMSPTQYRRASPAPSTT